MSERYGAPGELKELLENLEDWIDTELARVRGELQMREGVNTHDPRYNTGRLDTLRDVLDIIVINP
jgi:hypothetical protein